MKNPGVKPGSVVRAHDGRVLGRVTRCGAETFFFERGWLARERFVAPYDDVERATPRSVVMRAAPKARAAPREPAAAAAPDVLPRRELRLPLVEEELVAERRVRESGKLRLRKVVVTEERTVRVPVRREEVRVEQVSAAQEERSGAQPPREDEIVVPLLEEEVEVRTRPVVRREVRVRLEPAPRLKTYRGEVRREEIQLDRERAEERPPPLH